MSSQNIADRIKNYLGNGGLFNPELMEHDKVRNLLMDCRDEIDILRMKLVAQKAIAEHYRNLVSGGQQT